VGVNEIITEWWYKYLYPCVYNIWVWIGKNFTLSHGHPYFQIYEDRIKTIQQLENEYQKMVKKYGENFWKEGLDGK